VKSFRFRAQAVLDLRCRHRDAVQAQLAQAERAERVAAVALEAAEVRLHAAGIEAANALRAGGPISEFERHRNWIAHLRVDGERLRRVRHERAAEVTEARERLRVAHQRVRVLERLREQTWRRYLEAVRQQEMRDLNEVATLRFSRQRREGGQAGGT